MGPLLGIGAAIPPSVAGQFEVLSRLTAPIVIPPPYYPVLRLAGAAVVALFCVAEAVHRSRSRKKTDGWINLFYDAITLGVLISLYFNPYRLPKNFSLDWFAPELLAGVFLLLGSPLHSNDIRGQKS